MKISNFLSYCDTSLEKFNLRVRRLVHLKRNPQIGYLLRIFTLIAFLSSDTRAQSQRERPTRDPATWHWNITDSKPHVTHGVVHSKAMNRDVGYNIYLPPRYASHSSMRFPVVYFLHGASGSEYSDTAMIDWVIPEIEKGTIGDVIYVFVNGGHYSGYRDNPESNVMAETYLIEELVPAIDSRYRTIAEQKGRALFGYSMGGGGGTRLALKYPDLFCAVGSLSGALGWIPQPDGSTEWADQSETADNIYDWATRNQEKVKGRIGFYFTVGGAERLYDRHPPFMAHLKSLEIEFNYRVQTGLGHNLGLSSKLFATDVVRFLATQYREAYVP